MAEKGEVIEKVQSRPKIISIESMLKGMKNLYGKGNLKLLYAARERAKNVDDYTD